MLRFLSFTKDILTKGIGLWIVPWTAAYVVAFEFYGQFKLNNGLDDAGLGWPLIVLALMLTFGHYVFGPRFQTIYDKHFSNDG